MAYANDNQPTEEQVKAANEAEVKKWEGDFKPEELEIPYSRDEEGADDNKDTKKTDKKDEDKGDDDAKDDKADDEDVPVIPHTDPAPVVTVEDPGEYKPADYSFTIDIKGKSHKVDSAEKAAELAEEFAEDLSAKQLVTLVTKGSQIDVKQERDKEAYDKNKKTFDEQTATEQERQEAVNNIASEFNYLVSKQLLPEVPKEFIDADWSDPQVAKQPGVREQVALLNYMVKENEARAKAGVKPVTSVVDAYNAWKLDEERKAEEKRDEMAGRQRQEAGARVAGVSASETSPYVPKGIAVGNPNKLKRSEAIWDN